MLVSTLAFACPLIWGARAFVPYNQPYVGEWMKDNQACLKVLLSDIDCDENLIDMGSTGWEGTLEGDDDFVITDGICAKKCGDSLQKWHNSFQKHCAKEAIREPPMMDGRNQLCDKDAKTGKYCNVIIDKFPEGDEDYDASGLPVKYMCEPCYVRRLWAFDISSYSPANGWIEDMRDRMDKECPKSVLVGKDALTATTAPSTTMTASPESSDVSSTVTSAGEAVTTAASTPEATNTAVAEVTASLEDNAGLKLDSWGLGKSLVLVLGMGFFYL
ncbi:uncharacterized protein B0J16DRAFT_412545 [Fusarium flagelliforme]|uniref:Uncharacterized protein n=1 Tax=Fusarium flagelliforme TaxID=2675880 RepID=A0A395N1B4_9HYPO|nr:uncharacterized protein B0J16DRAFT_412545 [Fusarium flagelliforme]KAH7188016.1 hypothetical protein B0J16DRAFT_412545 [Fusarium flagelliforme]RFN53921.1 hypothetical protein FIE12Z_1835 [Fusarium flagelliforme]